MKDERKTFEKRKYSLVMLTCLHQIEMLNDNPIVSILAQYLNKKKNYKENEKIILKKPTK